MKVKGISEYLTINESCECGKIHQTSLDTVLIGSGVLSNIPAYLQEHGYERIFIVADTRTYQAAVQQLCELLQLGFTVDIIILDEEEVVPDEKTIIKIMGAMNGRYHLLIAVGTGTINDMCKYISYKVNMDYIVVATAPSMDGFASVGAALIMNNMKVTYDTHIAKAIFADLDILQKAPMDMITAGLGDILGKYTCLMDWKISHIINNEYYCPVIVSMVEESIRKVVKAADQVLHRNKEAIESIMEALVLTGIAMSFVGNSRPASGSEHHISHYWEMKFLMEGKKPVLHGTKVGIGTIAILKLYHMLALDQIDFQEARKKAENFDQNEWEKRITSTYNNAAQSVIELEKKAGKNNIEAIKNRLKTMEEKWPKIQSVIQESLPKTRQVEAILERLGAPINPNEVGVNYDMIIDSIMVAKEVRDRYGLLQVLFDLGVSQEYAKAVAQYFETGQMIQKKLDHIKCFVLDMDGTIYLGNKLFPYTKDFLSVLEETGRAFYFFTNNSSKSEKDYIEKLSNMGIPVTSHQMMISTHVIIKYLKKHHNKKSVYVVGTKALIHEFIGKGIIIDEDKPDIVILGFDTSLTYEKLEKACHFIRNGALYYGINPDFNCPMEGGTMIPDCGSIAKLIEGSTNKIPEFFGKPSPNALQYMIKHTGYEDHEIAVIGDRLYTDIAVTKGSNVTSILVLSGETTREDIHVSDIKPDLVVPSIESLIELLQK